METSALRGDHVSAAFEKIVHQCYEKMKKPPGVLVSMGDGDEEGDEEVEEEDERSIDIGPGKRIEIGLGEIEAPESRSFCCSG